MHLFEPLDVIGCFVIILFYTSNDFIPFIFRKAIELAELLDAYIDHLS